MFSSQYAKPRDGRFNAADPRRTTPRGELKMPKFVKFKYEDTAAGLDEIFWEDPMNFKPYRTTTGRVYCWGVVPIGDCDFPEPDMMQTYMRIMTCSRVYREGPPKPELQFVDALKEKKIRSLKEKDLGDFTKRDYILEMYVELMPEKHQVKRNVRVSGGLSLSVFSDKVIKPLFGLVRNLHAHTFTDFSDGSLFGPKDCSSIDMMHIGKAGYAYIPDKAYAIAHIVQKEGDEMGYYYDFGDNWQFTIKVLEIVSEEESTGAVTVLGGRGAHLPDGVAWPVWRDLMADLDKGPAARLEALQTMYTSTAYSEQRRDPNFDFDRFSVPETQDAVKAALDSKTSIATSSKKYVFSAPTNHDGREIPAQYGVKKGQKVVRTVLSPGTALEEGISTRRPDNPGNTACSNCGSPKDLKACSGCRQKYYCSRSCQRAHWSQGHKKECAAAKK